MLGAVIWLCVCGAVVADLHLNDDQITSLVARLKLQLAGHNVDNIHEDASLEVPALVRKYGYPLEEHHVTTSDGYILGMHRIPHGRDQPRADRPVVFIMHGLLCSSADWVLMGPGRGLAYILAEEGFDVWLGNARGNRYSRHHVILNPNKKINAHFWKFSWDEIGNIDLPTMIDYALEKSGKAKLHYVGHSQGTTAFFVMCSLREEYNQKIISMNALAPVAYLTHSVSPIMKALVAQFSRSISKLFEIFGHGEFLPHSKIMQLAGEKLCIKDRPVTQEICSNILFLIGGWNAAELNRTMLPVILSHTPAGASIRQFAHYGQVAFSGKFQRFDHGRLFLGNNRAYGTWNPPLYDLSKVRAPVFFHYSKADPFAHEEDVKRLWNEIHEIKPSSRNARFIVPMSSFSHLDFMWGVDAKTLVYDQVIKDMKRMQGLVHD